MNDTGGDFTDANSPEPIIESADDAVGTALLAFLAPYNPHEVPGAYKSPVADGKKFDDSGN
jgi:hypothetical protein